MDDPCRPDTCTTWEYFKGRDEWEAMDCKKYDNKDKSMFDEIFKHGETVIQTYDKTLEALAKYVVYDTFHDIDEKHMNWLLNNDMATDLAHEFVEDTEELLNVYGVKQNLDIAHNLIEADEWADIRGAFNNVFEGMWDTHRWGDKEDAKGEVCREDGTKEHKGNCFQDTVDYIDGLQACNITEVFDCESEELIACDVAIKVDGEVYEGDCFEMAEEWGVPIEGVEDECVPGETVGDCFEDVQWFVDGLEECQYTELTDCDQTYECYVDAKVNGEWISGDCHELAAYFDIPIFEDNWHGNQFYGDECVVEIAEDCTDIVAGRVRNVEYCVAYTYYDICTETEVSCYAVGKAMGMTMEGECQELADEYGIDLESTAPESHTPAPANNNANSNANSNASDNAAPRKSSGRRGN
jgi:hypothetical protein